MVWEDGENLVEEGMMMIRDIDLPMDPYMKYVKAIKAVMWIYYHYLTFPCQLDHNPWLSMVFSPADMFIEARIPSSKSMYSVLRKF